MTSRRFVSSSRRRLSSSSSTSSSSSSSSSRARRLWRRRLRRRRLRRRRSRRRLRRMHAKKRTQGPTDRWIDGEGDGENQTKSVIDRDRDGKAMMDGSTDRFDCEMRDAIRRFDASFFQMIIIMTTLYTHMIFSEDSPRDGCSLRATRPQPTTTVRDVDGRR